MLKIHRHNQMRVFYQCDSLSQEDVSKKYTYTISTICYDKVRKRIFADRNVLETFKIRFSIEFVILYKCKKNHKLYYCTQK